MATGPNTPPSKPAPNTWRTGPLFDEVVSIPSLSRAWDKVRFNAGAAGGDGVSIGQFARVADQRIRWLTHALRTGRYAPAAYRRVYIPKSGGSFRPLDIPSVIDRVAQASAARVLDAVLDEELSDASFAYRRGRSVAQAVARVAALRRDGYRHVLDGDIVRYFERIPHEPLMLRLDRMIDDSALVDLIWLWLEHAFPNGFGVPQGSPISPLLANLYLDTVDEAIESRGVRLVRFADDFLVLCKSEALADRAMERMAALLGEHGLELHPEKSRIVDFDQGFRFLGHVFVRSMILKEVDDDDTPAQDMVDAAEALTRLAETEQHAGPDDLGDDLTETGPSGLSPRLRPLYLLQPGRRLIARGQSLHVAEAASLRQDWDDPGLDGSIGEGAGVADIEKRPQLVLTLPPRRIGRIEIGPDSDATLAALDLAVAQGIEVVRINGSGAEVARYVPPLDQRAARHLAQARVVLDPIARLAMARVLVSGRVFNQRALLRQINQRRKLGEVAEACVTLGRVLRQVAHAGSIDVCRGLEGRAAQVYWPALGLALPEPFQVKVRRRRQGQQQLAPDPFNAVVSILSGLLARDVRTQAERAGLHVGFGALHESQDGEDALVHDLIEEFRAPLTEAVAVALFTRKSLTETSFETGLQGLRVGREAWRAIVRGYETKLAQPLKSPNTGERTLWRALIHEQAQAYARHCEGGAVYTPYALDH